MHPGPGLGLHLACNSSVRRLHPAGRGTYLLGKEPKSKPYASGMGRFDRGHDSLCASGRMPLTDPRRMAATESCELGAMSVLEVTPIGRLWS